MKVKHIRISNVLGIEELEVAPGRVTLVQGANGEGKTSVIEALKAVVKGGHDATLLRQGAEEGEIVLVLDNGMEVTKRITPSKSSLEARHPEFGRISAPQTWFGGLTDQMSVNPVSFLAAPNRVQMLLEAMPIKPDWKAIEKALDGVEGLPSPDTTEDSHALHAIAAVRKAVYDERTGVNRIAKDARASAERLQGSLPASTDEAVPDPDQLEATRRRREKKLTAALAAVDVEVAEGIGEIEREAEKDKARLRGDAAARKGDLLAEHRPEINRMGEQIAAARERHRAEQLHENTRQLLAGETAKAENGEARSKALTAAMGRLEGLKARLLADLPIPGVSIRDGEIYQDDIPYVRLNRAAQVAIAVQVAKLRVGKVPLICIDGLECLDPDTFRLFVEELANSDLQAVVTRVTDTPLDVRSIGASP